MKCALQIKWACLGVQMDSYGSVRIDTFTEVKHLSNSFHHCLFVCVFPGDKRGAEEQGAGDPMEAAAGAEHCLARHRAHHEDLPLHHGEEAGHGPGAQEQAGAGERQH